MELDVTQALLKPGETFPFEATVGIAPQDVDGETMTFDDVLLSGTYSAMDGAVQLKGKTCAPRRTRPARCA